MGAKVIHRDGNPGNNELGNLFLEQAGLVSEAGADGARAIVIEVSAQIFKALEELHGSGLFGLTLRDVLEEMVRAGVRDAIVKGWAAPPPGLVVRFDRLMLGKPATVHPTRLTITGFGAGGGSERKKPKRRKAKR